MGGGGGDSHGWTVRGRDLTVIQAGHLDEASSRSWSSRPGTVPGGDLVSFLGGLVVLGWVKLKVSLLMPSFFMASLVPRDENILAGVGEVAATAVLWSSGRRSNR
jgi:hypothetical protein